MANKYSNNCQWILFEKNNFIKYWISILLICASSCSKLPEPTWTARQGNCDLSQWRPKIHGKIELSGEWAFYWKQLLSPDSFELESNHHLFFYLPGLWNSHEPEKRLYNGDGFATFRLNLILPANIGELLFKIPAVPTAYRFWVNQDLIAQNGIVADTANKMTPWFSPKVIHYSLADQHQLTLTLQISNFFHKDGGMWQGIELGTIEHFHKMKTFPMFLDIFSCGCLIIMAFHHIGLFIVRKTEKSPLFFGLCCLFLGLRSLMLGECVFYLFFPNLSWTCHQKIEFIMFYLSLPAFCSFFFWLFPGYADKRFIQSIGWISMAFIGSVLLLPVKLFSQASIIFQIITVISSLYIFWASIKAYQDKKTGSLIFILGFLIILFAIINDILTAHMIIQSHFLIHYAIMVFVMFQAFSLSKKYSAAYTQIEEMTETLTEKNKALVRVDQLKDEFLANTSHELKTPLHGIIGISNSLTEGIAGKLNESQANYLSMINLCSKRLLSLINDLLDFSRIKRNDLKLNIQPTDIKGIIDMLVHLIQPMIKDRSVCLQCQLPDNLPLVQADEFRIQQIIFNLLGNAAKFTHQGEIVIQVIQQALHLKIAVKDTGPGIPLVDQEKIFNAFEQRSGSFENSFGGTGLGLSISQRLAQLHGTEISVESTPGKGSCFSFQLPIVFTDESNRIKSTEISRRYEPVISVQPKEILFREDLTLTVDNTTNIFFQGASVLAVDDDPVNRQLIYDYLIVESFNVQIAVNGFDALECIHEDMPDIVLLDIMMPGMNGFECCKQIRQKHDMLTLPIIILSAKSQTNDIVTGLSCGANDYLVKPFHKSELIARIQNNLQAKESIENIKEARRLKQEIQHRKEVEKKLDTAYRRLTRMLDCSDDAILMFDITGTLIFFNQSAEQLFEFQSRNLAKVDVKNLMDPTFTDVFDRLVRQQSGQEISEVIPDVSVKLNQGDTPRTIFLSGFTIPPDQYFSAIIKDPAKESSELFQQKTRSLEAVVKNVSEVYGKDALKQIMDLREMNPGLDAANDTLPDKEQFRMLIVQAMSMAVQAWENVTGQTKVDLADQSNLWKSYLDGSTWKTRTLDKYLNVKSLPKKPRWRQVVRTIHFVLKQCQLSQEKKDELNQFIEKIEKIVRLKSY